MMRMMRAALAAALLLAHAPQSAAQPTPGEDAVIAMRAADAVAAMQRLRPAAEVFDARFLADVPETRLAGLLAQLEAQHGRLLRTEAVERTGTGTGAFALRFERARATATLVLEPGAPWHIAGFRIVAITPLEAMAPGAMAARFAALPGLAGYAVARLDPSGPVTIQAAMPFQPFAIGSTFKLWVLDAVAEDVATGRLRWDQVVRLGPRSLPSGVTQDWPLDAAVTVETLATLMIAASDNTATDALIRLLGRDRLEARVAATGHSRPELMRPFLTTAEAFRLKLGPPGQREAFVRGSPLARLLMLQGMPPGIDPGQFEVRRLDGPQPVAIDSIEWFASPLDIVRVLDALRRRGDSKVLAILAVSPGMAGEVRRDFAYAGYKGGSETGVLNLSWLVRRPSGAWYAITASWNNRSAGLDHSRLELLTQELMALAQ
jgi:hypothetical protein